MDWHLQTHSHNQRITDPFHPVHRPPFSGVNRTAGLQTAFLFHSLRMASPFPEHKLRCIGHPSALLKYQHLSHILPVSPQNYSGSFLIRGHHFPALSLGEPELSRVSCPWAGRSALQYLRLGIRYCFETTRRRNFEYGDVRQRFGQVWLAL